MENLLVLLDKIQQVSPLPIFAKDVVIVQNAGMQHWLNMSLAKQRGISMNIDYALPSQFLWKLVRTIASDEDVPDQSPFSREVLAWRIYTLLAQDTVVNDEDFMAATQYWNNQSVQTNDANKSEEQDITLNDIPDAVREKLSDDKSLKRYQLACQMADLFEQYLIFRPTWIDQWENGNFTADITDEDAQQVAKWQGKLWYFLTREQSYNPITLIEKAVAELQHKTAELPQRISFFGMNVMAPMWLEFINQLSEYVDVHFFHLNPCYAYWGDVVTEKQAIKSIQKWVEGHDDIAQSVGNPLLANLGQQGREFMALLHDYSTINIDVFENVIDDAEYNQSGQQATVLQRVQHDILTLSDTRETPSQQVDNSIVITSCHSALREVQGLHDWLLHQFNEDPELTPKDVLVMCPHVEDYAPYVNAVFARGWQDFDDKIPPLPCSIADRISKDSEPVVAAFSDLLTLPDSRFQVSQLISFLRIPAMQTKFALTVEDIDKISVWLDQASIHWGLDQSHKNQVLQSNATTNNFTWQQGLSRLLQGFAFGDAQTIYNDQLLLPSIEGNDGELLGQLMLILEQLQLYSAQLSKARTPHQWQLFLTGLINELFETSIDDGFTIVDNAIESLVEYCLHAKFEEKISLVIVRDFLNQHFSQPEPGRQFMVGQVTFCSMLPMRSIPFKVIAILGLNDGLFPRQRQSLSFDLMSTTPSKLGDRSRRGDDRYLFLEAIISARNSLYLSYQGKNIKNNATKQASLVLKELMEYLTLGFGWKLDDSAEESGNDLRTLALQPFSSANFYGRYKSFDNYWLQLAQSDEANTPNNLPFGIYPHLAFNSMFDHQISSDKHTEGAQSVTKPLEVTITLAELLSFYQHPSRLLAKKQLNLHFESYDLDLEDTEPFDFDRLQTYVLREQLLQDCLAAGNDDENIESALNSTLTAARLSGKFPETIKREKTFDKYKEETKLFTETIKSFDADKTTAVQSSLTIDVNFTLNVDTGQSQKVSVKLTSSLPISGDKLAFYRSSSPKSKDFFRLYLHQLFVQVIQNKGQAESTDIEQLTATHGFYFDTKSQKITQYRYSDLEDATTQLTKLVETYFSGQSQPLLLNGDLAEKALKAKVFEQKEFEQFWQDPNSFNPLGNDPYMRYFWPTCPSIDDIRPALEASYLTMFTAREQIK